MKRARAHHYIPQFYLKGFTAPNGALWAYEKHKPIRKSTPKNEAHERDFYAYKDEQGELRDVEQRLADMESYVAPLFQLIEQGYHRFHQDDFHGLATFIALLWLRGPSGRDFVKGLLAQVMKSISMERAANKEEFTREYEKFASHAPTNVTAEEMRQFILSGEWDVEQQSYGYTLRKMFEGIPIVASILEHKQWEILIAQNESFCTSDIPIVTILPDRHSNEATIGTGFAMPGVHVLFPLNKQKCLVLKDRAICDGRAIRDVKVREVNKIIMVGARRFIYACENNSAMQKVFSRIGCKSIPGETAFMPTPKNYGVIR